MVARSHSHIALDSRSQLSDGRPIRCVVMRGGTSRGLFFHEHDLPQDPALRDRVIMAAVGAPDPRQVDGLGGADMLLSKVAIVSGSTEANIDVECEFANIAPGKDRPTYGTNCGNLVSAVALFAIDEGFISSDAEGAPIRIRNRNSGDLIKARIGSLASEVASSSDPAGMSATGVCVDLEFVDPTGTKQPALLPTGKARDTVVLGDDCRVDVSVVDAGALYVFVRASDLNLTATESDAELLTNPAATAALERIRSLIAHKLGLVELVADATAYSPDVPKLAFVAPPMRYAGSDGSGTINSSSIDLVSRIVSSQNYHKAYAVTGAIATAAAAAINGSVVAEAIGREVSVGTEEIRIGHPSGVLTCRIESQMAEECLEILAVGLSRTARRIMQGSLIIPNKCFDPPTCE